MTDISAAGLSITFVTTISYPLGFTITAFADDADPLNIADINVGDMALDLNGNAYEWSVAEPVPVDLNLHANTEGSEDLDGLFDANKPGPNKQTVRDTITMTVNFPNKPTEIYSGGTTISYAPGTGTNSSGKQKVKKYSFKFSQMTRAL